ncbi:MAG: hypothetical protein M9958_01480 [Chitinophagales bacterium]|nr:hypothetical protein [Chitinophagales bacterium]
MLRNIVVTYIYPEAINFFNEFIDSINNQSCKNFEVFIFNDGVSGSNQYFNSLNVAYYLIDVNGRTINSIRDFSIQYIKDRKDIGKIIFQDIDDLPSGNRFEKLIEILDNHMLVCNDLLPFNNNIKAKQSIWVERIKNLFSFNRDFIRDFNIVGLGNTAIRHSLLDNEIMYSKEVLAYDWFLFYQLMRKSNCQAVFTSECLTLYRQHEYNIAGVTMDIDIDRMRHVVSVKELHYRALLDLGFEELNDEFEKLEKQKERLQNFSKIKLNIPLYWWEETEYL